jgi:pimeloyl-ACP methyl ester carboxylesterase
LALAAACGRSAKAAPTPTLAPVNIIAATATPAAGTPTGAVATAIRPTPGAQVSVTVTAGDGAQLAAAFYPPVVVTPVAGQKAPGVLLLSMYGGSHADWDAFARQLQAQGMAALALDYRGSGGSPGPADWNKSVDDTRAAWEALLARPEVDPQRAAIIGASIGANLALIVGANNSNVATVVALSPGTDFQGLQPTGLLSNFGQRPVYLIASADDPYSYTSAQQMAPLLPAGEAFYYQTAGHGTAMFGDPDLATRLLGWLSVHIGSAKG